MDTIKNILENSKFNYEFIFHEKQIYSATEGAEFFGIDAGQTAPTLILKSDKEYISITFSGSRSSIDFKELAKVLNVSQVKLASRNDVYDIIGFNPGDTPMIGLTLPAIFDKKLLQYPYIYGGSGQPNRTLKIAPTALVELNHPIAFLEND